MSQITKSEEKKVSLNKKQGKLLFWAILILPALILTVTFIIIPVIDSVYKSFLDYKVKNVVSGTPGTWNDFDNYVKLFTGNQLMPSIINTFSFVFFVVLAQFGLGMALALVVNSNIKFARFIRSIMMTPWIVPTVISALLWMWLYQPQYGFVKWLAGVFGVEDFGMLNNPNTALLGIGIAALWKQIPLMTLLLLAGLQNVPDDMLEAAKIDGAGYFKRLFKIVIPYMSSVIKIAVSMSIIENFKQFPLFWLMTGGGPDGATTNLAILSYKEAFQSNNLGAGAAVTTVWMLLMVVVIVVYNKVFKTEDVN